MGGNVSAGVVRVGSTVRRPAGPWSTSVHAVLRHLEAVGYEGAPRSLGFDDQGRHVVEYVEGEVPDWDGAGPGSRLWDLSYAAHGFVPLTPGVPVADAAARLDALAEGYRLDDEGRRRLGDLLVRTDRLHLIVKG